MIQKENKKVLMIWTGNNNDELGGVGYYRIVSPANKLKQLGYDVEVVAGYNLAKRFRTDTSIDEVVDVYSNILKSYDLVWMKHTDNESALAGLFGLKSQFKCKVIWDFDDDLFNVRPSQMAYDIYAPGKHKRQIVASAISFCDALTVSTEPLKKSLSKLLKEVFNIKIPIYVCPNFINIEEWNKIKYRPSNSPTIGYYGSTTHSDDLMLIKKAIYKVLEKYDRVSFEFMGTMTGQDLVEFFKDIPNDEWLKRIKLTGGTNGWKGFPDTLLSKNWDIALAPLIDDDFNKCKSNIKWMETAMKQIPCICSDIITYNDSVTKTTGILSKDNQWFNKMSKLIDNPDYRVFIGKNARKYIEEKFSSDSIIPKWEYVIKKELS